MALAPHAGRLLLKSRAVDELVTHRLRCVPLTPPLSNPAGIPNESALPHWPAPEPGGTGMPLGVQSVACSGDAATMLQLTRQRKHAQPWAAVLRMCAFVSS